METTLVDMSPVIGGSFTLTKMFLLPKMLLSKDINPATLADL